MAHTLNGLQTLRKNWHLLVTYFSDTKEQDDSDRAAKYVSYLNLMLNFEFLAKCRIYEDILQQVSIISKIFQTDDTRSIAGAARSFSTINAQIQLLSDEGGIYIYI